MPAGAWTRWDAGHAANVRAVLSWSYQQLDAPAARLFRLLGLHAGPDISAAAAASMAGLPLDEGRRRLGELTRAHLMAERAPGRFWCHDLLRAYAAELTQSADSEAERRAATARMLDHYLHTAHSAALQLHPTRRPVALAAPQPGAKPEHIGDAGQALAWFGAEDRVLMAATARALEAGFDTHVWQPRSRGSVVGLVIAACMHAAITARRSELVGTETDVRTVIEIALEHDMAFAIPSALYFGADALIERPGLADVAALADASALAPDFARTASGAMLREVRGRLALAAGDLSTARAELRAAAGTYEALHLLNPSASCWRSARAELLAAGARPRRRALTGLEALTASERRVAELAAAGMSNSEIAQALFVTLNTVEGHLRHAYQKLSISSRGQLPAALRSAAPGTSAPQGGRQKTTVAP